ncbi:MAG: UvrB/UvrC motif-containing protein, partial [Helicobacter sp.]|nr:UvrB/UvrC motif-containing protein [Helicobacter sp.]
EIIRQLRLGEFDVLVGINLLREGLDLPEVALVAILDADKAGFLRSETSLIQTMGRAARNLNGRVILFANTITPSIKIAMDTTDYRRKKQQDFNKKHGIVPQSVSRKIEQELKANVGDIPLAADKRRIPKSERDKIIKELTKQMHTAAKALEFEEAARLRDEIAKIRKA